MGNVLIIILTNKYTSAILDMKQLYLKKNVFADVEYFLQILNGTTTKLLKKKIRIHFTDVGIIT